MNDSQNDSPSVGKVDIEWLMGGDGTDGWLHTHGMAALGFPELEIRDCPALFGGVGADILRMACDYMLRGKKAISTDGVLRVGEHTILGFLQAEPLPGMESHYEVERLQVVGIPPQLFNKLRTKDEPQDDGGNQPPAAEAP